MVILADDGAEEIDPSKLKARLFSGGRDNVPALVQAVRDARAVENGVVVWVHGTQPMKSRSMPMIEQLAWSRHAAAPVEIPEVSDQLARWWAATRVREALREQSVDPERVAFAAKYQLVTAFSGAVVLETAEQYARHGLTPVDATTTPEIPATPEPGVTVLLVIGGLLGICRRKRKG